MKQTLILLAGYPGTGKSYLAELLMKQFTGFEILSPDEIKEEFWDAYGFRNEQEKEELIQKSWVEYYHRMEWKFTRGISLLSDYPFSHKQHDQLQEVCDKHHVQIITIRMIADLDVLFERQKKRDLDASRHLGHIVKKYHKGICLKCHEEDVYKRQENNRISFNSAYSYDQFDIMDKKMRILYGCFYVL